MRVPLADVTDFQNEKRSHPRGCVAIGSPGWFVHAATRDLSQKEDDRNKKMTSTASNSDDVITVYTG